MKALASDKRIKVKNDGKLYIHTFSAQSLYKHRAYPPNEPTALQWLKEWDEGAADRKLKHSQRDNELKEVNKYAPRREATARRKRERDALSEDERLAVQRAKSGGNLQTEYDVSVQISQAYDKHRGGIGSGPLNDGTRADVELVTVNVNNAAQLFYLPLQVKTAKRAKDGRWTFDGVFGYMGMPVLLWRRDVGDEGDGWVVNGGTLMDWPAGCLSIKDEHHAALRGAPHFTSLDAAAAHLATKAIDEQRWTLRTHDYLSWDFKGKAAAQFLERVTLHVDMCRNPEVQFPKEPHGTADAVLGDSKRQHKHCYLRSRGSGFRVNLSKCAGSLNGKRIYVPYAKEDFDVLVVSHVLWEEKKVLVWEIPVDQLGHYLSDETADPPIKAKTSICVHPPDEVRLEYGLGPALRVEGDGRCGTPSKTLWTRKHFKGVFDLPAFPAEAEKAGAHFFAHFRKGGNAQNYEE